MASAIAGLAVLACVTPLAAEHGAVPVTALAFTPDGTALVSNGPQRIDVRLTTDGTVTSQWACDLSKITSLTFHPRGSLLAAAGGEPGVRGEVQLFEWPAQKLLQRIGIPGDLVSSVAFNAAGTSLAIAGADNIARIWRIAGGSRSFTEAFTLTGHAGPVLAIAFSPPGRTIVTGSADRSIKVWSAVDGRLLRTFGHHLEAVNALAFRPEKPAAVDSPPCMCASASDDRTVRVWQPETGRMVRIIRQHRAAVLTLVYSPDGACLFSAGKEGVIRRLDAGSDRLISEWPAKPDWIYSLAVSPDGLKLAAGDWSGKVHLLDPGAKK